MRRACAIFAVTLAAGCAQDQGSTLSCPGPGQTGCDSLTTVYERAVAVERAKQPKPVVAVRAAPKPTAPVLSPPRLLRVWIAPWKDADGDLHDQQHLYMVMDPASWSIGGTAAVDAREGDD